LLDGLYAVSRFDHIKAQSLDDAPGNFSDDTAVIDNETKAGGQVELLPQKQRLRPAASPQSAPVSTLIMPKALLFG